MEPGFPMVDDPNMQEDLIEDFDDAAVAIEDTYQPKSCEQGVRLVCT
jgi:hypothetical protein